jgi:dTDP-4-dehydrorhamnose 3,5-epimerase
MVVVGTKDQQTVLPGGGRGAPIKIAGVHTYEFGNVITRSGFMTEIFRTGWSVVGITVRQINWIQLNPGAVSDWHVHAKQTDHLVGVGGNIKLMWPRSAAF